MVFAMLRDMHRVYGTEPIYIITRLAQENTRLGRPHSRPSLDYLWPALDKLRAGSLQNRQGGASSVAVVLATATPLPIANFFPF